MKAQAHISSKPALKHNHDQVLLGNKVGYDLLSYDFACSLFSYSSMMQQVTVPVL